MLYSCSFCPVSFPTVPTCLCASLLSAPCDNSYVYAFTVHIRFTYIRLSDIHRYIHSFARLHCSSLRISPTMASADFSQFVVTTADETTRETSRDKSVFFPRLPSQFTHMGYGYLLGFVVFCQLTRHIRLNIGFLFVGLRFRYPFFSPAPHDANLRSRYKVRR